MNFSALARIPFQAVLAVCDALVESDAKRQARMLSRMYPDMDALNEIEGEIECHEPDAPYLSWGTKPLEECSRCHRPADIDADSGWCQECLFGPVDGPGMKPRFSCLRCGYPHSTETQCLRDRSISFKSYDSTDLPLTPEGGNPGEVRAVPPAPSPGVDPSGANGSIPPGAVPGEGPSDSAIPPAPEGHPNLAELIAEVLAEHEPWGSISGFVNCYNHSAIETLHAHCNDWAAWREHVSVNIANRILLRTPAGALWEAQ